MSECLIDAPFVVYCAIYQLKGLYSQTQSNLSAQALPVKLHLHTLNSINV